MNAAITAGQELGPMQLALDPTRIAEYLRAAGDTNLLYGMTYLAPPPALAAFALAELLKVTGLPPGTMHLAQEVTVLAAASVGAAVTCKGRVTQRSQRRDGLFWTVEFSVADAQGNPVMEGKTTLLTPGQAG
ncbi:MAG: MaoC family dehydratase N-terminal domain-containing protein [Chloroflexi bacterium]|nr:MaoC family dehydratase N-terminal domain-containing protein [Chloroflexota bacterium]